MCIIIFYIIYLSFSLTEVLSDIFEFTWKLLRKDCVFILHLLITIRYILISDTLMQCVMQFVYNQLIFAMYLYFGIHFNNENRVRVARVTFLLDVTSRHYFSESNCCSLMTSCATFRHNDVAWTEIRRRKKDDVDRVYIPSVVFLEIGVINELLTFLAWS